MDLGRREDFHEKLQMFYTNQKSDSIQYPNPTRSDAKNTSTLPQNHNLDVALQMEGKESALSRIMNLEAELIEERTEVNAATSTVASDKRSKTALSSSTGQGISSTTSQIEENRKHEKQATQAIAAHDEILIRRLEAEVVRLQSQHETDLRLMIELSKKVADLTEEKEQLHQKLVEQVANSRRLEIQVQILTDHVQRGQFILENERKSHSISHESILAANSALRAELRKIPTNLQKSGLCPLINSPRFGDSHEKSQSLSQNLSYISTNNISAGSKSSPKYSKSANVSPSSFDVDSGNRKYDKSHHENYHEKYDPWSTENHLRAENAKLLNDLEKERELLRRQEKALDQVRTSAEEITLLEAEEIVRLETELEICSDLKDEWEKKCKNALSHVKQLLIQQSSSGGQ